MTNPYPLPRETRESEIFVGDGVSLIFGPFLFKIFDVEDVSVQIKVAGSDWTAATATVSKVSGAPFDFFTVEFSSPPAITSKCFVAGTRLGDRETDLTRGGSINSNELEKETSKHVVTLQELRRDLNRSLAFPPDFEGSTNLPSPEAGKTLGWNADGSALVNKDPLGGGAAGAAGAVIYLADTAGEVREFLDVVSSEELEIELEGKVDFPIIDADVDPAAAIASTKLSYLNPAIGGVPRSVRDKFRERASVMDFGADPGASAAANRLAFQKAMNSISLGGMITIPAGDWNLDATAVTVPSNYIALEGDGFASNLKKNTATGDTLSVQGAFCIIEGLQFTSLVPRTAGSFVNLVNGAHRFLIRDFFMTGAFRGVSVPVTLATATIADGYVFESVPTTGRGIDVSGGFDITVRSIVMDGPQGSQPQAGVFATNCGDLTIEDCNIIGQGQDIFMNPGAGQSITSLFCTNTFFDTAQRGVFLQATGGGVILRSIFEGCWMSSHVNQGVLMQTSTGGIIDGVDYDDCHMFLNAGGGFNAADSGVKNISVLGGQYAQNTGTALNFNANVQRFKVKGATIGDTSGLSGNTTGIAVAAGCDNFSIEGNTILGNGTNISLSPSLGPTKIISDNIGFVSENSGQATIPSGTSVVIVNHGLNGTPRAVTCELIDAGGGAQAAGGFLPRVLGISPTQFSYDIGVAASANRPFHWRANL